MHPLLLLITVCSCASFAQKNYSIDRIEFKSSTRGAFEEILISSDSLKMVKKDLSDEAESRLSRKLDTGEWDRLVKSLKDVPLPEINTYASPTNRRTSDGARHSAIIITTHDKAVYQHAFDNRNPYIKLQPLMQTINEIAAGDVEEIK